MKYKSSKIINYDFESDKYKRKFYDSTIVKFCQVSPALKNTYILTFEILTEFWDEVFIFDFDNVEDILASNSLAIFPEIREIDIIKLNKDEYKCIFRPMWGDSVIEFKFTKLTITENKLKNPIVR